MKRLIAYLLLVMSFTHLFAKGNNDKYQYEIEIAEIGQPGTLVIRTWCYDKKPNMSDDVFKECAIKGVLFKGLNDSGRMKGRKALVEDGYDQHKDYFDNFFDNGAYQNYARIAVGGYVEQNNLIKVGKLYKVAKIVVVSFNELRAKLENDKIIKGLNNGF